MRLEIINNVDKILKDDLSIEIKKDSKVLIAEASFFLSSISLLIL